MRHIFLEHNQDQPVFLLLHGTGGDEHDLLPLAKKINPIASVLSVRGSVDENGQLRYFKRLGLGVFDQEDLFLKTHELSAFLDEMASLHSFNRQNVIALGYSNGANMALSMVLRVPNVFKAAILLRPMRATYQIEIESLDSSIFIGAGKNDPICPPSDSEEILKVCSMLQADATLHWYTTGHQLSLSESIDIQNWAKKSQLW